MLILCSVLGMAPLIATFILFDFVVYNFDHVETPRNRAYLEIAGGYFQRLYLATEGAFGGNLIAELVNIAKDDRRIPLQNKSTYFAAGPSVAHENQDAVVRSEQDQLSRMPPASVLREAHPPTVPSLGPADYSTVINTSLNDNDIDHNLDATLFYPMDGHWADLDYLGNDIDLRDLVTQNFV